MSKKILLENISHEDLKLHIKQLYSFLKEELPKINKDPKVFLNRDQKNANDFLGKTGFYDPETYEIHLFITDRHGKDILRSFAHEIIHHEQNCSGFTSKLDMSKTQEPDYAEKDDGLREAERDAFERGNMLFRKWTDRLKAKRKKEKNIMNEENLKNLIKNLISEVLTEKKKKTKKKVKSPSEAAGEQARKDARKHLENYMGKDVKKESGVEAKEKLQESINTPYPQLFEEKERLLKDAFQKRESLIFEELVRRITDKG